MDKYSQFFNPELLSFAFMKTLVCQEPGSFSYEARTMPEAAANRSILKIKQVGICGTDYHAFEGTQPFFNYPRVLGHEIAAEIAQTGADSGFQLGELVTISPYFYCGTCIACRNGNTNCCQQMSVCGVHQDGAMTEYLSVPDTAIIPGAGLSEDQLVLVEPLAIGAHGLSRAKVKKGEYVLIIGAGPIGLGTMNFARIAEANVIAMDVDDARLAYCQEKLGVPHLINPLKQDAVATLAEIPNGDMPTVVIDCSGNRKALNDAFSYMAHTARYVMIGLQKQELVISHPEFHKREATLMSSRNALPEDFKLVIEAIRSSKVKPEDYITHKLKFDEVKDQFVGLSATSTKLIKAVITFD